MWGVQDGSDVTVKNEVKGIRQNLMGILLAKGRKDLSVDEEKRVSHFLWINERFASRTTYMQSFLAESESEEEEFLQVRYTRSLGRRASEQGWLNLGLEEDMVLEEEGM